MVPGQANRGPSTTILATDAEWCRLFTRPATETHYAM